MATAFGAFSNARTKAQAEAPVGLLTQQEPPGFALIGTEWRRSSYIRCVNIVETRWRW
jgi:hypothetical protein